MKINEFFTNNKKMKKQNFSYKINISKTQAIKHALILDH